MQSLTSVSAHLFYQSNRCSWENKMNHFPMIPYRWLLPDYIIEDLFNETIITVACVHRGFHVIFLMMRSAF